MNQVTDQTGFGAAGAASGDEECATSASAKGRIARSAREVGESARQMARQATGAVKDATTQKAHELREQTTNFAQERKSEFAGRIRGGGQAVRRAAEKLREENDPNIAHYAEAIAGRLEQVGDYIQSRDFGSIFRDVEVAARRRPELVFGGMFVAGLAIARFLKATSENSGSENDYSGSAYGGNETDMNQSYGTPKVSMADVPESDGEDPRGTYGTV